VVDHVGIGAMQAKREFVILSSTCAKFSCKNFNDICPVF